jgi:hypothetical protein
MAAVLREGARAAKAGKLGQHIATDVPHFCMGAQRARGGMTMAGKTRRTMGLIALALGAAAMALADADEALAQEAPADYRPLRRVRPRPRIRVAPAYPYRTFSTDYPVPYEYEYPGPGAVRQCNARLVPENRPSGPVIVPRMHCWWER